MTTSSIATLADTSLAGDVAAALAAAEDLTDIIDTGEDYIVVAHPGHVDIETVLTEVFRASPRRARGAAELHTATGLTEWVTATRSPAQAPALYADLHRQEIVAVLNPATEDHPAWQDHLGRLQVTRHPAWERWRAIDGELIAQAGVAAHIQSCAADIASPSALDMLEVAETLTLNVGARVSSAVRQRDGQRHIVFDEQVNATAGHEREIDIPETLTLRVPIFDGGAPVEVTARLLYRATQGQVGFIVQILDGDEVERDAFDLITVGIAEDLALHPIWGRPASP